MHGEFDGHLHIHFNGVVAKGTTGITIYRKFTSHRDFYVISVVGGSYGECRYLHMAANGIAAKGEAGLTSYRKFTSWQGIKSIWSGSEMSWLTGC